MLNPIKWYKDKKARESLEKYISELYKKWEKDAWEWHVPLQKESIAARGPFLDLCKLEKEKLDAGGEIDKTKLKTSFAELFEEMLEFNEKIIDEFVRWYHSDEGEEWRVLLESKGLDKVFLEKAGDILQGAAKTTLLVCQYNSKELIDEDELYELCKSA